MIENEIYTGAIRRLDDLCRIAIPKSICMKAGVIEGTPFEVYYTKEGDIILRPYDEYRLDRENIRKADEVLQTLNSHINIVVFDKNNVIYSSTQRESAPINNYKITQAMEGNRIDEIALNEAILELYPHASLSVDDEEGIVIALVTSMGQKADALIFDYLWNIIKK